MNDNEKKLSDFIDSLNNEKTPDIKTDSEELDGLYKAVRQVKSLKEPAMPDEYFLHRIMQSFKANRKTPIKSKKKIWIGSIVSIAAILVIAVMINFINPINDSNIVYAMEQAYNDIKAYHGTLEVVFNNKAGEKQIQSILDIWVDKNDNYYIEVLEGSYKGLKTISNGEKVWQLSADENAENVLPVFTETYEFIFELGNEIDDVKNAETVEIIGEDKIAGRASYIMEVTPKGGLTYKLWVDKETKLPLQKQDAMNKAIQYTTRYTEIHFEEFIPEDLVKIDLNEGFKEIDLYADEYENIDGNNIVQLNPEITVEADMEIEKAEQIAADSGSSPWKLDPVYVAQIFVSLQLSPEGIVGDYPINYDDLVIIGNDGMNVMIGVNSKKTDIKNVYLSRLIRQDETGIWTVMGYDNK